MWDMLVVRSVAPQLYCVDFIVCRLPTHCIDRFCTSRFAGTQFFLNAKDSGKARAVASVDRIRALNPYAHVDAIEGEVCEKDAPFFAQFNTVVLVNRSFAEESHVNKCCRENGEKDSEVCRELVRACVCTFYDSDRAYNVECLVLVLINRQVKVHRRALLWFFCHCLHGLSSPRVRCN